MIWWEKTPKLCTFSKLDKKFTLSGLKMWMLKKESQPCSPQLPTHPWMVSNAVPCTVWFDWAVITVWSYTCTSTRNVCGKKITSDCENLVKITSLLVKGRSTQTIILWNWWILLHSTLRTWFDERKSTWILKLCCSKTICECIKCPLKICKMSMHDHFWFYSKTVKFHGFLISRFAKSGHFCEYKMMRFQNTYTCSRFIIKVSNFKSQNEVGFTVYSYLLDRMT